MKFNIPRRKLIGKNNPNWRGGISKDKYYKMDYSKGESLHNIVIEKKIGRNLKSYEVAHHIDLDKSNNSENNLYLCKTRGTHSSIHHQLNVLGKKFAIFLLKKDYIYFDKKNELYRIKIDKFEQMNSFLTRDKDALINILKYSKEDIKRIKKRRREIIRERRLKDIANFL